MKGGKCINAVHSHFCSAKAVKKIQNCQNHLQIVQIHTDSALPSTIHIFLTQMLIRQKITNLLISSLTLMLLLWIHDLTHIYARKRHDFRSGSNEYVLGGNLLLSSITLTNRHFIWPCDTTKAMNLSHLAQKYTLYHHILLRKVLSIKCTIIITVVALCCYQYLTGHALFIYRRGIAGL